MKLHTLIQVLMLVPILAYTQNQSLSFESNYYECEDKWIAFPKDEADSTYMFGFIYLDEQAGFTFNLESKFKADKSGKFIGDPRDTTTQIKVRLEPGTKLIAILPEDRLSELNLPEVPEWLHFYKTNDGTVKGLVKKGYHYNHVGASSLAIQHLEKAYQIEQNADGLEFELAYAYNATGQLEKAISVLKEAIAHDPKDFLFYRVGFSQIGLGQITEAEKTYLKGIELSDDKFQKSEMTVNMAQAYYHLRDKTNFKKWAKLTKKYADKDSEYLNYIKLWDSKM